VFDGFAEAPPAMAAADRNGKKPRVKRRQRPHASNRILTHGQALRYAGHDVVVHSLRWSLVSRPHTMELHRHSHYEALLTIGGEATEKGGFGQCLRPGTLQLIPPGSRHGWVLKKNRLERLALWMSIPCRPGLRPLERWPVAPEALDLASAWVREAETPSQGRAERLQARLLLLASCFLELLEWPAAAGADRTGPDVSLADVVDGFLEDNLAEPIGLADAAIMANVSVPTLNRRYRAERGRTVGEQLAELRMQKAASLLRETELTVKVIAGRSGFRRPSYFCLRFRERFGCTPTQYRGKPHS
jgi:AraC-like DNA-binding protein